MIMFAHPMVLSAMIMFAHPFLLSAMIMFAEMFFDYLSAQR